MKATRRKVMRIPSTLTYLRSTESSTHLVAPLAELVVSDHIMERNRNRLFNKRPKLRNGDQTRAIDAIVHIIRIQDRARQEPGSATSVRWRAILPLCAVDRMSTTPLLMLLPNRLWWISQRRGRPMRRYKFDIFFFFNVYYPCLCFPMNSNLNYSFVHPFLWTFLIN